MSSWRRIARWLATDSPSQARWLHIGIGDPVGEFGNGVVNPVPYKLETFTWLGRLMSSSNLAVASKKSGSTSFDQVKKASEPSRLATFGVSAPLIQMIILSEATKIKLTSVNFRTPADVAFGLVRGDVDLANLGIQLWLKHIQAGNAVPFLLFDEKQDDAGARRPVALWTSASPIWFA